MPTSDPVFFFTPLSSEKRDRGERSRSKLVTEYSNVLSLCPLRARHSVATTFVKYWNIYSLLFASAFTPFRGSTMPSLCLTVLSGRTDGRLENSFSDPKEN